MKSSAVYSHFGARLKKLRGRVTQKEFAEKLGITEQAYQNYEYGKRFPDLIMLFKISALCGVFPSDLIPSKLMEGLIVSEDGGFVKEFPRLKQDLRGKELELSEELHRLKEEGFKIRDKIGSIDSETEKRYSDPRLRLLLDKIHFIFEKENETIKRLIIDVVNQATELAVATMIDVEGQAGQETKQKREK